MYIARYSVYLQLVALKVNVVGGGGDIHEFSEITMTQKHNLVMQKNYPLGVFKLSIDHLCPGIIGVIGTVTLFLADRTIIRNESLDIR